VTRRRKHKASEVSRLKRQASVSGHEGSSPLSVGSQHFLARNTGKRVSSTHIAFGRAPRYQKSALASVTDKSLSTTIRCKVYVSAYVSSFRVLLPDASLSGSRVDPRCCATAGNVSSVKTWSSRSARPIIVTDYVRWPDISTGSRLHPTVLWSSLYHW
jgi:hypothetical protein